MIVGREGRRPSSTKKKDLSEEGKKRGKIEYIDFKEKYGKKYNKI